MAVVMPLAGLVLSYPEPIHGFLTAILPIEINENTAQHFCG